MGIPQELLMTAQHAGFTDARESGDGTVLWLRKKTRDVDTRTHQRMCIDSLVNSATVYWISVLGKTESKTFRTVLSLHEWLALQAAALRGIDSAVADAPTK